MYQKVIQVYKKCGQTPLDCINEVKKTNPELTHLPLTYAGRLDPLAEGVLIILVGDECLKKDDYLSLSKEYEVDILFGFKTDTYDLMGKILEVQSLIGFGSCTSENLKETLLEFTGRITQAYPPYSSRTVEGKPLFEWARSGKIDQITIPSHDVFVENIDLIKEDFISGFELLNKIKKDIGSVSGDFRQEEILNIWNDTLKDKKEDKYKTITLRISCGGGVYIRSIANELGKKLSIPAIALNIKRIRVGEYKI